MKLLQSNEKYDLYVKPPNAYGIAPVLVFNKDDITIVKSVWSTRLNRLYAGKARSNLRRRAILLEIENRLNELVRPDRV